MLFWLGPLSWEHWCNIRGLLNELPSFTHTNIHTQGQFSIANLPTSIYIYAYTQSNFFKQHTAEQMRVKGSAQGPISGNLGMLEFTVMTFFLVA